MFSFIYFYIFESIIFKPEKPQPLWQKPWQNEDSCISED